MAGGTVVIGLGSPLMGDDGLGLLALETLRRDRVFDPPPLLVDGGTWGLNLLPVIESAERLLLVDAELTLHGRRNLSHVGKHPVYAEYEVANYFRAFRVSEQVAPDKIAAAVRRHSAKPAAPRFCPDESLRATMVFRRHRASEVDGPAGHVRVYVNAAGKDNHPGGIDRPTAVHGGGESAPIVDEKVFDFAVDPVGGVIHFSARDSEHLTPVM